MSGREKVVGESVIRIDALDKVTGRARFGVDVALDGMLHAKLLRSPHPHARVLAVDSSEAETLPGVRAVVRASEVPRVVGTWFNLRSEKETKKLFLRDDKVRFIGDSVLAVVADDERTAEEALGLIDVEYEVLEPVFDPLEAMERFDIKIHERGNVGFHIFKEYGDLEAGFAQADVIVQNAYSTSKQTHASLEPQGACIATYSADGVLTMHSTSQVPHWVMMYVSLALGIPMSKVRVIRPYVGGAFGGRAGVIWGLELMCAYLATRVDRPVRLAFTREEDFAATESRHPFHVRMKTGATKEGLLVANEANIVMDVGGYGTHFVSVLADALGTGVGIYRIPAYTLEGTCVYTNKPLCGAFRGYGNPQMNFAQESQLDELAERLGIDPVELRLKNYRGTGEMDPVFNDLVGSCGMADCLTRGAEAMDWSTKWIPRRSAAFSAQATTPGSELPAAVEAPAAPAESADPSETSVGSSRGTIKRGVGMAAHQHGTGARFGLPDPSSATVRLNADGSVNLLTACADDGQGNRTVLAQICAEVLGVGVDRICVSAADTGIAPLDGGTHGSRQTYCSGVAVLNAATEARTKVLALAAEYLEMDGPDRLDIVDGFVCDSSDPTRGVHLSVLMRHFQVGDFSRCHQVIGDASGVTEAQPAVFGATFAEVEVDTETGQVRVLNMAGAFDVGRAVNPMHCEGQITGGLTMGVGYALTEGLVIEDGRVLNPNFTDYKILRATDAPQITPVLVESYEATGPFGAKGLGEATMISSAAAIANAVYNAVGVRMRELCITPEKILQALEEAGRVGGGDEEVAAGIVA
jgi:CO/xanthine dehydrogenase Mo-binding subunit